VEIPDETPLSIAKPSAFDLNKFKSKRAPNLAGVETLLTKLPHHNMSSAKDFVRLHPDEENYWSPPLCFVNVPTKGQRETLHLIDEDLALRHLPSGRIQRFRLALAALPDDRGFFLCHVPSENLDNTWNDTNLQGCVQGKTLWTALTSRKDEGIEAYKIERARNPEAFPEPSWPQQTLANLIYQTFDGRMIDREDHPGLLRLLGDTQSLS
jgi:hypothetical protein